MKKYLDVFYLVHPSILAGSDGTRPCLAGMMVNIVSIFMNYTNDDIGNFTGCRMVTLADRDITYTFHKCPYK